MENTSSTGIRKGFSVSRGGMGMYSSTAFHKLHNFLFPLGLTIQRTEGGTVDNGSVVTVKFVEIEEFTELPFQPARAALGIVNHVHFVQENNDLGNIHLAGQEDVLARLGHRSVCTGNNDDGAVHLGSTSYHVLYIVSVTGAVNVCIVTTLSLVFNVSGVNGDTTFFFFRSIVDGVEKT